MLAPFGPRVSGTTVRLSNLWLACAAVVATSCGGVQLAPKGAPVKPVQFAIDHSELLNPPGCTGVEVSPRVIVTAKHCLNDDAEVNDNFTRGGVVGYISEKHDFAIIVYPMKGGTYVGVSTDFIAMREAVIGEHLYVVGYPVQLAGGKQALTITDGIAAGPASNGQARITAPAYFGNSGGGVWGDDGALLGIAVSIYVYDDGVLPPVPYAGNAYMVPVAEVVKGLNEMF